MSVGQPRVEEPSPAAWRCCIWDGATARDQMTIDERLAARGEPVFRLFRWAAPAISLGLRQEAPAWAQAISPELGVERVERPTGGGIALHGSDLSCSAVIPRGWRLPLREIMRRVCEAASAALCGAGIRAQWTAEAPGGGRVTYCLTQESPYAIFAHGRKVCGFGIRRYAAAWLVQGSMLIRPAPAALRALMPASVAHAYRLRAAAVDEFAGGALLDERVAALWIAAWKQVWAGALPAPARLRAQLEAPARESCAA